MHCQCHSGGYHSCRPPPSLPPWMNSIRREVTPSGKGGGGLSQSYITSPVTFSNSSPRILPGPPPAPKPQSSPAVTNHLINISFLPSASAIRSTITNNLHLQQIRLLSTAIPSTTTHFSESHPLTSIVCQTCK